MTRYVNQSLLQLLGCDRITSQCTLSNCITNVRKLTDMGHHLACSQQAWLIHASLSLSLSFQIDSFLFSIYFLIRVFMNDMHVGFCHYDSLVYLQIGITLNSIKSSVGWSVTDREPAIDHRRMSNTSPPISRRQGWLILPLLQFYAEHISPVFCFFFLQIMFLAYSI